MQAGRRKKVRYIQKMPRTDQFSPRGKPGRPNEAELKVDEFEAIKLTDYQGYNQAEGAQSMGISRPTFGRILRQGRRILADALVNGKTIRIRIGSIQVGVRQKNLPAKREMKEARFREQAIRQKFIDYPSEIREMPPQAGPA